MQNFIYALIQVVHNVGAATVVATAASALWLVRGNARMQRRLAMLLAIAWATQVASGVMFGVTTYLYESHLPDIHGIAVDALLIKLFCALSGFVLAVTHVKFGSAWAIDKQLLAWRVSFAFGVVALGSAAFLRWFS
ncbi:MAG: hypothetical protein AWT59_1902 [Candidatus Gallionella acididurans]|uniref:Uncharacterized protein n=1 Tax=Candidatus Gallionella acididurans TaxID=1796491 RepID=A0A139BSP2_9PROT|nr:MAG: hypothetical protein AWT59_1902 [Candidatus Gallionella acididurans]